MIPNRLIRSERLDVFDKAVFLCIASCNPSFPSYRKMRKWTGLSLDRIGKSLKNLEANGVIKRYYKHGKSNLYETHWSVPPDSTLEGRVYRPTESSVPPDSTEVYRWAVSIKNK